MAVGLVIGAGLGTAALATSCSRLRTEGRADPSGPDELAAAMAQSGTRAILGRLSGGSVHRPSRPWPGRSGDAEAAPEVRIAAARRLASAQATPEGRARRGVAQLLLGRTDAAILALEESVADRPGEPRLLSDLSAAYLERNRRQGRSADLPRALSAAERALVIDARVPEAWFNAGLALEALHLRGEADRAWTAVLDLDPSAWATEARERRQRARAAVPKPAVAEILARLVPERAGALAAIAGARQETREWIEDDLFPEWGRAVLGGRGTDADPLLARALAASEALAAAGGDAMPLFAARAIQDDAAGHDDAGVQALARAHVRFAEARHRLADLALAEAAALMGEAAADFSRGKSPYALWAPVYSAISDRMAGQSEAALLRLGGIEAGTTPAGFAHWRGRVLWTRAVSHASLGNLDVARGEFAQAADTFARAGEGANASAMETMLAETLGDLGDEAGSWDHEVRALERLERPAGTTRPDMILLTGAYLALGQDMPEVALHFHNNLVGENLEAGDGARLAEAYLQRANTHVRLRHWAEAEGDLRLAQGSLDRLADRGFRERLVAEIHATRARAGEGHPRQALGEATAAITYFAAAGQRQRVAALLIDRSRAARALGQLEAAEADLVAAIRMFEEERGQLASIADKRLSFEDGRAAFAAMIRLQAVDRRRPEQALRYAERARGWEGHTVADPGMEGRRLPRDTVALYYVVLDDRLLIWTLTRDGTRHLERPTGREALDRLVSAFREAIDRGAPRQEIAMASGPLFAALLGGAEGVLDGARRLVVLPDGPLYRLPFAALQAPSGRYLVEDHALEVATSLSAALRAPDSRVSSSVLAVGDGHTPTPSLPRLPDADAEAADVAAQYPRGVVLSGPAATTGRLLGLLPGFEVVHYAGHSVVNADHPEKSSLLLAPDRERHQTGRWLAEDIQSHSFRGTRVVVLASCASAAGRAVDGESPLSLVRPFLAGGVDHVVASLWDVDDRRAGQFFHRFHGELRRGLGCSRALQQAQIAAILESGPGGPAYWAGFQAYGGLASQRVN